nr:hypothetical protein [Tanacetum cinerariifolium]
MSEELLLGQKNSHNDAEVWVKLKETYDKLDGSSPLSGENLLDVEDAFAIISREESQISGFVAKNTSWPNTRNKKFDNKKFANTGNNSNNNGNNMSPNLNLLCKNYRKVGHTIDRCFDLIGYPSGYNKNHVSKSNGFKNFNENSVSTSSENGASLSFTDE